jgi:hypothetical protein
MKMIEWTYDCTKGLQVKPEGCLPIKEKLFLILVDFL